MLDFAKLPRRYCEVKLKDGARLNICTPTKRMFDDLSEIYALFDATSVTDTAGVSRIYELFADVLSRTKEEKKVAAKELEETYSMDDVQLFFAQYTRFVGGETGSPN